MTPIGGMCQFGFHNSLGFVSVGRLCRAGENCWNVGCASPSESMSHSICATILNGWSYDTPSPAPLFEKVAAGVKDNKLRAVWAEKDNGNGISWDAADFYCTLMGKGWKLPSSLQLASLHTKLGEYEWQFTSKITEKSYPFRTETDLIKITSDSFWSSEFSADDKANYVLLLNGSTHEWNYSSFAFPDDHRALCINEDQNPFGPIEVNPVPVVRDEPGQNRFATRENGVGDLELGIIWSSSDNGANITWDKAVDFCRGLGLGWELPSVTMLRSLKKRQQPSFCIMDKW